MTRGPASAQRRRRCRPLDMQPRLHHWRLIRVQPMAWAGWFRVGPYWYASGQHVRTDRGLRREGVPLQGR